MITLFDSHAHLTSSELFKEMDAVIARAAQAGVHGIVNIATDEKSLEAGVELAKRYPWIFNAAASHPHDVQQEGAIFFPVVARYAQEGCLAAVGETGLDYHYNHSSPECQQEFLRKHLRLAKKCHLPVIIHCREAFADFFKILDEEYVVHGKHCPAVLHCFTGSLAEAEEVLSRGLYLSLSGIVTFKKSAELRKVAEIVPLDQLLIETDAPYLAPNSRRGKLNEPAFIVETAQIIADAKGISLKTLAVATRHNAARLFRVVLNM